MSEDNIGLTDREFSEGRNDKNWLGKSVARIKELKNGAISHAKESAIYLGAAVGGVTLGSILINHSELLSNDPNLTKLLGIGLIAGASVSSGGGIYEGFRAYQNQSEANALTVTTELATALSEVAQPVEEQSR